MPQITLRLSDNIKISAEEAKALLKKLHSVLIANKDELNLDVATCFSGLLREDASYIGFGDETIAKCFYEILWMETPSRVALSPNLSKQLMAVLDEFALQVKEEQNLICMPRIRIADLGAIDQHYFFSSQTL
jgi:hypothetical protein